jgi:NAD(P)-dependent dehydrogenase (short-subunit alcohol dehydrogenase family)
MICDVSKPEQITAVANGVLERFGRCDIFVNNAAILPVTDLKTVSIPPTFRGRRERFRRRTMATSMAHRSPTQRQRDCVCNRPLVCEGIESLTFHKYTND